MNIFHKTSQLSRTLIVALFISLVGFFSLSTPTLAQAQSCPQDTKLCVNVKSDCVIPNRTCLAFGGSCSDRVEDGFYTSISTCCRESVTRELSRWYNGSVSECVSAANAAMRDAESRMNSSSNSNTSSSNSNTSSGCNGGGIFNPVLTGSAGCDEAGAKSGSLFYRIISGILTFLMLVGVFLTLLNLVLASINWISSGGDSGKVEKARDQILNAIIGMIVLSASYAVWLVVNRFLGVDFTFSQLFP